MYPVSDRFLQRTRTSGKVKTVVDLLFDGEVVATDIPISEGSIRVSRDSESRRSGSLVIPDPSLVPSIKSKTLLPYGTEIRIRSGFVYPDGEELVPLGIFLLEDTDWEENQNSIPSIEFYDRAKAMSRYSLPTTMDVSGHQARTDIANLPGQVFPLGNVTVTIAEELGNARFPGGTTFDTNYWDILSSMVETINGEVYFDVEGNVQVVEPPFVDSTTSNADAVWIVDVGPDGVLISANRGITRSDTFNSVIVKGGRKSDGTQAYSTVANYDSNSPTFYNGPFGRTRKVIDNSALVTDQQCYALARSELRRSSGLSQTVSFTSLRNPALEAGDIILFKFFDGEEELHVLDGFTFDFASGVMSAETRARVVNI